MKSNIGNIGYYTTIFLNDYAKRVSKCEDIQEYFNLITSIYIFQELVFKHLKKEFELDSASKEEVEDFVKIIKQRGDELIDYFDKKTDIPQEENKAKDKININ